LPNVKKIPSVKLSLDEESQTGRPIQLHDVASRENRRIQINTHTWLTSSTVQCPWKNLEDWIEGVWVPHDLTKENKEVLTHVTFFIKRFIADKLF